MRLFFCADCHAGNHRRFGGPLVDGVNERCKLVGEALLRAATRVSYPEDRWSGSELFILGDLFDTSNPTPQVITVVQKALRSLRDQGKGDSSDVTILRGNHDQVSSGETDDALGPMWHYAQLIRKPHVKNYPHDPVELFLIPFQTGPAAEWLPGVVAQMAKTAKVVARLGEKPKRILMFHLGIADEKTPEWLRGAHDSIDINLLDAIMVEHHIDLAVAGNWHNHQVWLRGAPAKSGQVRTIVQCGALVPTGFDNPGLDYGKLVSYDTKTGVLGTDDIPGPRFLKVSHKDLSSFQEVDAAHRLGGTHRLSHEYSLFLEVACPPELEQQTREQAQHLVDTKVIRNYDVVTDATHAQVAARSAATAARSAGTLDEALVAYVEKMPLEPGVKRESVLALSRKFYASAGTD
jgi:hypothetical protein